MDPQASPPKRVTRARAAAGKEKKKEPKIQIATASARAMADKTLAPPSSISTTATVATTTSALLAAAPIARRTRAASHFEDDEHLDTSTISQPDQPKTRGRGRPKKVTIAEMAEEAEVQSRREEEEVEIAGQVAPEPAPVRATRRAKKTIQEATAPAATRTAREKRPVKKEDVTSTEPEEVVEVLPVKRSTRGRPATTAKAPTTNKKSVKFETTTTTTISQDKENIPVSQIEAKDMPATGLKAKPIRKAASNASRSTRGATKPQTQPLKSSPLSPKKITQVSPGKSLTSEDELAGSNKTPVEYIKKSPIKPSANILSAAHKLNDVTSAPTTTSVIVNHVQLSSATHDLNASTLASPARRVPSSPFKDSLKTSATHVPAASSFTKSPLKPNFSAIRPTTSSDQSSFGSNFQSPAKRPGNTFDKKDLFGSPSKCSSTPFKNSLLQSPAKRMASPIKAHGEQKSKFSSVSNTPRPTTFAVSRFATPKTLNRNAFRPGKIVLDSAKRPATENRAHHKDTTPFTGRLSSIVPRDVDPVLSREKRELDEAIAEAELTMLDEEDNDELELDIPRSVSAHATGTEHGTTPVVTPPRHSTGVFTLRTNELEPAQTNDSDSEDELAGNSREYSPLPMPSMRDQASTPRSKNIHTPMTKLSARESNKLGFTPLAQQLSDWMGATPAIAHASLATIPATPLFARTPSKAALEESDDNEFATALVANGSPDRSLFNDEMALLEQARNIEDIVHGEDILEPVLDTDIDSAFVEPLDIDDEIDAMTFAPEYLDEQDLELAVEAEEMSLLDFAAGEAAANDSTESDDDSFQVDREDQEMYDGQHNNPADSGNIPAEIQESTNHEMDISLSDASQDYGDENLVPEAVNDTLGMKIAASQETSQTHSGENSVEQTPKPAKKMSRISYHTPLPRYSTPRVIHTTSKVPLKPAAAESPIRFEARSQTAVRPTAKRPAGSSGDSRMSTPRKSSLSGASTPVSNRMTSLPPTQTPAQTPRPASSNILQGVVVFVDVHTVEGADASAVFVELLTSMGARCVKSWAWNPSSSTDDISTSNSKIGITHVVFKDGGKRTIEKVREAGGVVQCVGVGWVLDCERHEAYVSEAPYQIDTTLVPRGGHRRRKSMEPKALQALNHAAMVPEAPATVATQRSISYSAIESKERRHSSASPKFNRRKSTAWVRSPASSDSSGSGRSPERRVGLEAFAEETMILSPAPRTPDEAEIMRRIDAAIEEEGNGIGEPTPFGKRQALIQQTMPVVRHVDIEGEGEGEDDSEERDGKKEDTKGVLMHRLLMARRKSLQWAPKVGSPLARG